MDRIASDPERKRAMGVAKAVLDGRIWTLDVLRELFPLAHTDAVADEADRRLIRNPEPNGAPACGRSLEALGTRSTPRKRILKLPVRRHGGRRTFWRIARGWRKLTLIRANSIVASMSVIAIYQTVVRARAEDAGRNVYPT